MRSPNRHAIAICLALAGAAGVYLHIAANNSAGVDGPAHLVAGLQNLTTGDTRSYWVNPPYVDLAAASLVHAIHASTRPPAPADLDPYERPEFRYAARFVHDNLGEFNHILSTARLVPIAITLLGMLLMHSIASHLYGPRAGWLAAGLWLFSSSPLSCSDTGPARGANMKRVVILVVAASAALNHDLSSQTSVEFDCRKGDCNEARIYGKPGAQNCRQFSNLHCEILPPYPHTTNPLASFECRLIEGAIQTVRICTCLELCQNNVPAGEEREMKSPQNLGPAMVVPQVNCRPFE